ncbi:dCMP deaminase [Exophiala aquamarina CBS 119918]|uniref:Deoxycytidylate deaminase n=1 Tax=Exophiala aquamarina CBS 119918 TaxID=1182545 RepID=A0A072P7H7_9EURO|nr:dCMP deaminase [Exophiala aquamarina CBS 119918]KEF51570.1 dCMP deaminase [Exophiala aquamarina CBS 119918]
MPISDFIAYNDLQLYGSSTDLYSMTSTSPSPSPSRSPTRGASATSSSTKPRGTAHLASHAHLQILNAFTTPSSYSTFLSTLDLPSPIRLRPTWDAYFMTLASLASQRSNCMKRRVGCVLVHNARIISTGYNGTPRNLRNCNEGGCARCNAASTGGSALSTCLCLHAEENALLEAGRERIREGAVLYCDTCPCLTCSVKIAQVGVKEVVFSQSYNMDDASRRVLDEAGVLLRQFSPPRTGLLGSDGGHPRSGEDDGEDNEVGRELVVVTNGK